MSYTLDSALTLLPSDREIREDGNAHLTGQLRVIAWRGFNPEQTARTRAAFEITFQDSESGWAATYGFHADRQEWELWSN